MSFMEISESIHHAERATDAMAHSMDPSLPVSTIGVLEENRYIFDTSKMHRLEPRPLEETIRDSLAFFKTVPASDVI